MSLSTLPNELVDKLNFLKLGPLLTHSFVVDIDGQLPASNIVGGFREVRGLQLTGGTYEVRELGYDGVHTFPAEEQNRPVALIRGLSTSRFLIDWRQQVINWQRGQSSYARDVVIYHLHWYRGEAFEVWAWQLLRAWPSDYQGPEYDANAANDVAIEQIVLEHAGLSERKSIFNGIVGEIGGLL